LCPTWYNVLLCYDHHVHLRFCVVFGTVPPPADYKLKAGIGVGIAASLLLAAGVCMSTFFYKARESGRIKLQLPLPFMHPARRAGFSCTGNTAGPDAQEGSTVSLGRIMGNPTLRGPFKELGQWPMPEHVSSWLSRQPKRNSSAIPSSTTATSNLSSGTAITSTALDLMMGNLAVWSPFEGLGVRPMPQGVPGSGKTGARNSGEPLGSRDAGSRIESGMCTLGEGTGRADSGSTFYSFPTGAWTSKRAGESPAGILPFAAAGNGEGLPEAIYKAGQQARQEDLWTKGVNPADVQIEKDSRGRAVVLGRGAYAVVYLGRWQATLVAVKVMLTTDSDAAQREVQAEADILRRLRHPNVVLLMAVCVFPDQVQWACCRDRFFPN
jgi:hypothetical protein